ncbi:MAG: FkbM family methyltransferase [Bdellovibrionota bacterium]
MKHTKEFTLTNNGSECFVVMPADDIISRAVYLYGSFDFDKFEKTIQILISKNYKIETLIDVGANIGTICIPALKRNLVRNAIAIEPELKNFRLLSANILLNDLSDKIHSHNIALGDKSKQTLNFELSSCNSGDHRVQANVSQDQKMQSKEHSRVITVKSEKFDDIIPNMNSCSQLIWIDTQGYEAFVLEGATTATNQRVPVVIEFWPAAIERTKTLDLLKKNIFKYHQFYDLSQNNPISMQINDETISNLYLALQKSNSSTDILLL